MELDKYRRVINGEKINPTLSTVDLDTLSPVVKLCAKARADYLESFMEIANNNDGESCTTDQIEQLRLCRIAYEELVSAANALETVISRGYVDVKQS